MEKQLQVVKLGCAIYLIYGLLMVFNLGVFLPPVPLKMIFIGAFALILSVWNFKQSKKLYRYLLLYGISIVFTAAFFLEIFLSQTERFSLENTNTLDYLSLAAILLLTVVLLYLSFQNKNQKIRVNLLPLVVIALVWLGSIFEGIYLAEIGVIAIGASFYYVFQTSEEVFDKDEFLGVKVFFCGAAGIYSLTILSDLILFLI